MSLDEIIDRERKRAFGFTDGRRCLLTYGGFRRLLTEIESAAKREECELLAKIAELRQKIDDGKFFTPKAARDAIAGERPLGEMLKAPLPTGNAAALREAVDYLCERLAELDATFDPSEVDCLRAALSAPPKNCDRLSADQCKKMFEYEMGIYFPKEATDRDRDIARIVANGVIDALYTERKGESDGK